MATSSGIVALFPRTRAADDASTVFSSRGRDGGSRRHGPRPAARPDARRSARRFDAPHPDLRRDHRHPAAPVLLRPPADPGRRRDGPGADAAAAAGSPRALDADEPATHHGIVDQQRAALVPAAQPAGRRRRYYVRTVAAAAARPHPGAAVGSQRRLRPTQFDLPRTGGARCQTAAPDPPPRAPPHSPFADTPPPSP